MRQLEACENPKIQFRIGTREEFIRGSTSLKLSHHYSFNFVDEYNPKSYSIP